DGDEILALQVELLHGGDVVAQMRRRIAPIERVDVVAPLLERSQPLRPWSVGIGDVVHLAAEAVDLEHRLALVRRQDAHRRVERATGRGGRVTGFRRGFLGGFLGGFLLHHAPAAGLETGCWPTARRAISRPMPARLQPTSSSGDRCTRSLRGSRTFSMRTILSAKAWITDISTPSRKSFTSALKRLLSPSRPSVRAASACRHWRSGAGALASPSISTVAPEAASASRGR